MAYYSIALDGPAGVGKSTIAKSLAKALGYIYVDTGAMFRALAVLVLQKKIGEADEAAVSEAVGGADVGIVYRDGEQHVLLDGADVTAHLRTEDVSRAASQISQYPAVRAKLLELQRGLARTENVIMDGRDIGTVVLPQATLKIFLTASSAVRAKRRYRQLEEQNALGGLTLSEIQAEMKERDYRDSHRAEAPLRQAEDALLLDSSEMTAAEVEAAIRSALEERIAKQEEESIGKERYIFGN